ncbi:MAG TPA: DNA polymerase I [Kiritimatiellia bacterium]|nr:DNA polymerase I [Kiritimatiellia bacterium]
MATSLYLLDGMALIYRAHFAFIRAPIFNSKGVNTSALYGFTNTLLDILDNQKPDHIGIALDTPEPTDRHLKYPAYKAHREDMPEDIAAALPMIDVLAGALNIPVLKYPGHEADDVIGSLAAKYASDDLHVVMVTPDKDFAQLVKSNVTIMKPGRAGSVPERLGVKEVVEHWLVPEPSRVADVLGLWGDASDNIPGIPGFGEKTAKKLVQQYGSIEGIYDHIEDIKGRQREKLEQHKDQALLSRELATINTSVEILESLEQLRLSAKNDDALKSFLVEHEFNSIGRRIYGESFKAGRGFKPEAASPIQGELFGASPTPADTPTSPRPDLKTLNDTPHAYTLVDTDEDAAELAKLLSACHSFCFDLETDGLDYKSARIAGIAFCFETGKAWYVRLPQEPTANNKRLSLFSELFTNNAITKTGHNLKFDVSVLAWHGIDIAGRLIDTMIAHFLLEPDRRHKMDDLAEQYLGYTPIPLTNLLGDKKNTITMFDVEPNLAADYAAEDADVTWQLHNQFIPMLEKQDLKPVFDEIEMPLLPVLVRMEKTGIRIDRKTLAETSRELESEIRKLEISIYQLAGVTFNLNSPRQLGEVLFDKLALVEKPKKTATGQYSTDESILAELAPRHEIARLVLDYREASKLKSTYVDALPEYVHASTNHVHTSFSQIGAITGRLASSNPNLQNIPIRTPMGQKIRAAFTASNDTRLLLSADYSQIELRVMAELSGDPGMNEAFQRGHDIHTATAARVYHCNMEDVTPEMRRNAKMVNFGIIYGISAFGLSQRLGISRSEATAIIDEYFKQYPGVKVYMDRVVAECRAKGYVETLTGRKRWIRDINSANATTRNAAERMAINSPIQGTAADMIKIAMIKIDSEMRAGKFKSAMVLQVHDELLFDLEPSELPEIKTLVTNCMRNAIPLSVPILIEIGTGKNWLEAH